MEATAYNTAHKNIRHKSMRAESTGALACVVSRAGLCAPATPVAGALSMLTPVASMLVTRALRLRTPASAGELRELVRAGLWRTKGDSCARRPLRSATHPLRRGILSCFAQEGAAKGPPTAVSRDLTRGSIHALCLAAIPLVAGSLLAGALGLCSAPQASARPRYGGTAPIVWTEPISLADPSRAALPSERALSALLFETLFERTEAGPRPLLVEAWRANDDSTEWTVAIKRNVEFHNGKPLTADDVVFSIQRILQLSSPCSCRWALRNLTGISPVPKAGAGLQSQAAGPETGGGAVLLMFSEPEPDLPLLLSCPGLAVVPHSKSPQGPDTGEIPATPPGTGPFRIKSGRAQSRFELGANESHHLGRPFLDGVTWEFSPFAEGLVEFQAGAALVLAGIAPPVGEGRSGLPAGTARLVSESSYMLYLACNPARPALADMDSRLTVLEAVDRASIHKSIVGGSGRIAEALPAGREAPSALWGRARDTTGTDQNGPSDARQGGERQGEAQRRAPPELTLLVPRWNELISDIGDRIQVDLIEAGFSVRVLKMGREELAFKLAEGEFDLFLGLWAPDRWLEDYKWLMYDFWETQLAQAGALKSAVLTAARRRRTGGGGGTDSEGSRGPSAEAAGTPGGGAPRGPGVEAGGRLREGTSRSPNIGPDPETQSSAAAFTAGDRAKTPRAPGPPAAMEEILAEKALLLPLFHMDLVIYLRQWLVPGASSRDGVPDLAWSWLRAVDR